MSDLYLCACEQFYTAHDPDCPAQRQYLLAVAEIERLRNELDDAINKAYEEFAKYEADIERLKAERDEWRAVCTEDYEPRMGKLQAVVDAARHLLAGGDKEAVYHLERAIAALEQEK